MSESLKPGDHVSWNTPQGQTTGRVARVATGTTKIKGHVAKAKPGDPQLIVQSDSSGKEAAHHPEALKRV